MAKPLRTVRSNFFNSRYLWSIWKIWRNHFFPPNCKEAWNKFSGSVAALGRLVILFDIKVFKLLLFWSLNCFFLLLLLFYSSIEECWAIHARDLARAYPTQIQGINWIWTQHYCITGAMMCQFSYEATNKQCELTINLALDETGGLFLHFILANVYKLRCNLKSLQNRL